MFSRPILVIRAVLDSADPVPSKQACDSIRYRTTAQALFTHCYSSGPCIVSAGPQAPLRAASPSADVTAALTTVTTATLQGHVYRSETGELQRWHQRQWITDENHLPNKPADLQLIHVCSPDSLQVHCIHSASILCQQISHACQPPHMHTAHHSGGSSGVPIPAPEARLWPPAHSQPPQAASQPAPACPTVASPLQDSLVKSVVKRLMSDAPLGVLLSGGLDSSLVASIAAKCAFSLRHHAPGLCHQPCCSPHAPAPALLALMSAPSRPHFSTERPVSSQEGCLPLPPQQSPHMASRALAAQNSAQRCHQGRRLA